MTTKDTQRNKHTDDSDHDHEHLEDRQRPHRNPRLVIGTLDYFDMLMEQDEEG